jgi:hypothetical protein
MIQLMMTSLEFSPELSLVLNYEMNSKLWVLSQINFARKKVYCRTMLLLTTKLVIYELLKWLMTLVISGL